MNEHVKLAKKKPLRSRRFLVSVTDDEYQKLLANAGDQALAEWMRNVCLGEPEKPVERKSYSKEEIKRWTPPPAVDPHLIRHIAMIGNNVNQIARALNQNPNADSMAALVEIQHIQKALDQLVEIHRVSENNGG